MSRPLKWHGGKHYLARKIIAEFPPHVHYVEPFFGGGGVLFAKPADLILGHSEVVNDINGCLINFWQVLACEERFEYMTRILEATPVSELRFNKSLSEEELCGVYGAVEFFIRYRQSRQGLGKYFTTMSRTRTRRGMNEQASSWLSAIEGLASAHARLKRVVIFNKDAKSVIKSQDAEDTLFYLDPPYVHSTRSATSAYEFEMHERGHENLLLCLDDLKGKFILSGYHSPLYDNHALTRGWRVVEIEVANAASSRKVKEKKIECLWMNY